MKNFNYYAPTQVAFGRNTESQVAELVKKKYGGSKVLPTNLFHFLIWKIM